MPARERNEKSYLAVAYSHPRWMVERFVDWFGVAECRAPDDGEQRRRAQRDQAQSRARFARRNNREAERRRFRDWRARPRARDDRARAARRISSRARIARACFMRNPRRRRWWRGCLRRVWARRSWIVRRRPAAKRRHLAEMVGECGRVIAVDLNFNGLRNARGLAHRLRHRNVEFVCADLTAAAPLAPSSCRVRAARRAMHGNRHAARASGDQVAAQAGRSGANGCDTIADARQRGASLRAFAQVRSCIRFAASRPKRAKVWSMDFLPATPSSRLIVTWRVEKSSET